MMSDMKGWAVKCIVNLQNTCAYIISTYRDLLYRSYKCIIVYHNSTEYLFLI